MKGKFCEQSTENLLLILCALQSTELTPFNIALQMHDFIFGSF